MIKIGIDCGHTLSGADTGAVGCGKKEQDCTREIGEKVINKLKQLGYEVVKCYKDTCTSLGDSLSYRTNTADKNGVDVLISIHLNASNGKGHGTEVFTFGGKEVTRAREILNNICNLGYDNRGIKDGSGLYVIKNTKATAMLVECCFIDNKEDMNKYDAEKIANAIVKGITNKEVGPSKPQEPSKPSKPEESKPQGTKLWENSISGQEVKNLQSELNKQCGAGLKVDGYFGDSTLNACITVKEGAKGNITKCIQQRLLNRGYDSLKAKGGADGVFGNGTTVAIKNLQKNKGLIVDGIVGKNTWKALYSK